MDLGSFAFVNSASEDDDDESQTKFSWRLDPEKSFSDWTIELEILASGDENSTGTTTTTATENVDCGTSSTSSSSGTGDNNDDDDTPLTTTFHVHKVFIGSGDRRSLYFESVFNSSQRSPTNYYNNVIQLQEGLESTSKIKLERSAVKAFPIMLDFMYSSLANGALDIKKNSSRRDESSDPSLAVALRFLSTYFGIKPMFNATNEFIRDDLSIENAHLYLKEATVFSDDKIVEAAVKICSEQLESMMEENMVQLSPEHFSLVVEKAASKKKNDDDDVQRSELLSRHVQKYCDTHRDEITAGMLAEWTHHRALPVIASDAAISLLRHADAHNLMNTTTMMMEQVDNDEDNYNEVHDPNNDDDDYRSSDVVVSRFSRKPPNEEDDVVVVNSFSLYERCAKAAAIQWETTLLSKVRNQEDATDSDGYNDISDKTKVLVLEKALVEAASKLQAARELLYQFRRVPNCSYFASSSSYSLTHTYCDVDFDKFVINPSSGRCGAALENRYGEKFALYWIAMDNDDDDDDE